MSVFILECLKMSIYGNQFIQEVPEEYIKKYSYGKLDKQLEKELDIPDSLFLRFNHPWGAFYYSLKLGF